MNIETPLGIRNNNPGNIRVNPNIRWQGEMPSDGPYCVYGTPLAGLRALAKTLWTYQNVHGCRTIGDFVSRFAPANENETQAYIDDVCTRLTNYFPGPHIETAATTFDINRRPEIEAMMRAIIWHENGCQPYSASQINDAIVAAGDWKDETEA